MSSAFIAVIRLRVVLVSDAPYPRPLPTAARRVKIHCSESRDSAALDRDIIPTLTALREGAAAHEAGIPFLILISSQLFGTQPNVLATSR